MSTNTKLLDDAGRVIPSYRLLRTLQKAPFSARLGLAIILIYIIAALFAPLISPHGEAQLFDNAYEPWAYKLRVVWADFDPVYLPYWLSLEPTGSQFILGTDQLGRDILSRLIFGARNTIGIAFAITVLAFVVGVTLGILSAVLRKGWFDVLLNRVVEALMSIPSLIFTLMLLSIFGISLVNLVLIIALLDATRVFRLARAVAMNVVVIEYVEVAILRGEGLWWVMLREILPNVTPPLVSEFGIRFCFVFLNISALSFLGVGIQPPLADWGSMVRENAFLITFGDITPLLPAIAIAILTIAVNLIVDWFLNITSGLHDEH